MSSSRKPTSRRPSPAPITPAAAPAVAAEGPGAEPVARYTWEEIRARVPAADAKTLARYPVAATPNELIKEGATLRSERILTDLRLWLGDIVAWWSKLTPEERAATVGFSDARLQVVTHHAFALIGLVRRASKSHAKSDHAAAVAVADTAYANAQRDRHLLRAVLDQAAPAAVGFAQSVAAADTAASDTAALDRTLGALVELARDTLRRGGPVAEVLTADGLTEASLSRYVAARAALRETHEKIRGAAGDGPVAQSELDQQDGLLLLHMEGLRKTFRALRAHDRRAPQLIARSTGSYFGRRARKPDAAAPPPADGGKATPATR